MAWRWVSSGFANDPHSERGHSCPRTLVGITDYQQSQNVETIFTLKPHQSHRQAQSRIYLVYLTPETFATRAAFYFGEINAIRPFRDGNGRSSASSSTS